MRTGYFPYREPHNIVYRGNVGLNRDFLVEWRRFQEVEQVALVERLNKVADIPKAPDFRDLVYLTPEGLFRLANILCTACALMMKNNKPDGFDIQEFDGGGISRLSDYIYSGGVDEREYSPEGSGKNWIERA